MAQRKCFQCGARLRKKSQINFCDGICLSAYDLKTWGGGKTHKGFDIGPGTFGVNCSNQKFNQENRQ